MSPQLAQTVPEIWLLQQKASLQAHTCVAHVVQRSSTVCLADIRFCDALAKCHKTVGYCKHSPANTEELHQQQKELGQLTEHMIQDISTRWNLSFTMISHLLKNQEAVNPEPTEVQTSHVD